MYRVPSCQHVAEPAVYQAGEAEMSVRAVSPEFLRGGGTFSHSTDIISRCGWTDGSACIASEGGE